MNITEEQDWYEYYASLSEEDKEDIVRRCNERIEQSLAENRLDISNKNITKEIVDNTKSW